jgi:hypothetical protein
MKTKIFLFAMIVLGSAAAFGQASPGGAVYVQPLQFASSPQHADMKPMASEQSLVGGMPGGYLYAQGERPLWEFGPVSQETPLGDVARAYRKEKQSAKKAQIVFEKEGS